jgi:hypothetical protein
VQQRQLSRPSGFRDPLIEITWWPYNHLHLD